MSSEILRLAAAQYDISHLSSWVDYETKINNWFAQAVASGSQLLVFPEYFSMELASLFGPEVCQSLSRQLVEIQSVLPDFVNLFGKLCQQYGVYVAAGTFPVQQADGSYRNRCYFFSPDGRSDYQDKLQMTRFENEQWFINPGSELKTFLTEWGQVGINICYDSEFPLLARKQVEAGANLIIVPSCTDTNAGYWRVRIGCQARALENQCFVVQSPTVGLAPWSEAVDVNIGAAAIYTPVDYGFPDDGVMAIGELNQSRWVFADINLTLVDKIRQTGQVFNYRDWEGQYRCID